ncbi:hypothetical protein Q3G72_007861 [Acer saccharum]|nr:hypothetical protein Q3G72_007861 [Acer saccharum]
MIGRKNPGNASPLLLVLSALGFFFATYNLLTVQIHSKSSSLENWASENSNFRYHVALTATDAPYSQWQSGIMYYWYKKVKDISGSDMGKFTRVLHSGKPDNLMEDIPTFVVDTQSLSRGSRLVLGMKEHRFLRGKGR